MSIRMNNIDRNNKYIAQNNADILGNAPKWAVNYVVANEKLVGYYANWMEAMDACGINPGAILAEL